MRRILFPLTRFLLPIIFINGSHAALRAWLPLC